MSRHISLSLALLAVLKCALAADPTQLRLVNNFRAANGVGPLVELDALDSCAYAHSYDMNVRIHDMSHTGSDGSSPASRISRCVGSGMIGENVAKGYQYVQNVMTAWQNSPVHRANLLNPGFNAVGFGTSGGYWTQNFAYVNGVKPPPPPAPSPKPSPSPPAPAKTSPPAAGVSPTSPAASSATSAAASATASTDPAEPTYIPPENGVLLDVNSDSYIVPVSNDKGSNGTNYDNGDGNAAIYVGDEEQLAKKSTMLMAKMDASAYQLYLESKNTSVINPFLVVSFESAASRNAELVGLAIGAAVAVVGVLVA